MALLERLFAIGPVRKAIWQWWYPYLTERLRGERVYFLNYAFESEPPLALPLDVQDQPNRACIQLYHHVTSQIELKGKHVLEVSCGHGGGASWIKRFHQPALYTGLDLNASGIRFCQQEHSMQGLNFIPGDAQQLPFPDQSQDVVINVEASHCYPDFMAFLHEVARVLKPGGHFLYADFRFHERLEEWDHQRQTAPLTTVQTRDISAEVKRGMERNAARSEALIQQIMPPLLRSLGRDFAGVPGSRIYEALKAGEISYQSWCLRKD